jgi:hypothetical protein
VQAANLARALLHYGLADAHLTVAGHYDFAAMTNSQDGRGADFAAECAGVRLVDAHADIPL